VAAVPPSSSSSPLAPLPHIDVPDALLSPAQREFNARIDRLEMLRQTLKAWQTAIEAFWQRHARDYRPPLAVLRGLHRDLVRLLDERSDDRGMSRADRATIAQLIAELVPALLGDGADSDAQLRAILQRHAAEVAQPADQEDAATTAQPEEDPDSPESIVRRVEQEMQARRAAAEQAARAAQTRRRSRQKAPAPLKKAIEAHEASQSLRTVYRQLASALHPDRETDAAERTRKTALMQRANAAYAREDLLALLELQQEAEQLALAASKGTQLAPERLAHYNQLLARQEEELAQEIADTETAFRREAGIGSRERLAPDTLGRALARQVRALQQEIEHLHAELSALADDRELRQWLKFQRRAAQAGTGDADEDA
jgi:hypothetical protein